MPESSQPPVVNIPTQPINGQPSGLPRSNQTTKRRRLWIFGTIAAVVVGTLAGAFLWFNAQLAPVGSDPQQLVPVTIEVGTTPADIGELLRDKGVIRSAFAFEVYTRLSNSRNSLQAGSYRISPADSLSEVVQHLVNGRVDQFDITFLPGATLAENRQVLLNAGFQPMDIDRAFVASYDSPLFADKPEGSDLEGYIYGETYSMNAGATVEDILQYTFDQFYKELQENNIIEGIKNQGLTLHQGIVLASIVQREVITPDDQKQAAQVFYSRLSQGMMLGSDVTYQYITDKLGVPRDINFDSPYNTRRFTGLPPGPIATPGLGALQAVAAPASGDYLFFLSGDDGVTYFARTDAEHQANIRDHCQIKCSVL